MWCASCGSCPRGQSRMASAIDAASCSPRRAAGTPHSRGVVPVGRPATTATAAAAPGRLGSQVTGDALTAVPRGLTKRSDLLPLKPSGLLSAGSVYRWHRHRQRPLRGELLYRIGKYTDMLDVKTTPDVRMRGSSVCDIPAAEDDVRFERAEQALRRHRSPEDPDPSQPTRSGRLPGGSAVTAGPLARVDR